MGKCYHMEAIGKGGKQVFPKSSWSGWGRGGRLRAKDAVAKQQPDNLEQELWGVPRHCIPSCLALTSDMLCTREETEVQNHVVYYMKLKNQGWVWLQISCSLVPRWIHVLPIDKYVNVMQPVLHIQFSNATNLLADSLELPDELLPCTSQSNSFFATCV